MIKYKKPTIDTLRRFPYLYRMQAQQVLDKEVRLAIASTADSFVMASLLVMIEEYGLDTSDGSDDVQKFISALQKVIDFNSEYYEEAIAEGLRHKLREYGVEYE